MEHHDRLRITLWDAVVGYLIILDNGAIAFEFEDDFKKLSLEISPFELPLATTGIYQSKETSPSFQRLPGIFADCLPDRYGKSVIDSFYQKNHGWDAKSLNPLDYLSYLSDRSIGAFNFEPALPLTGAQNDTLDLALLMNAAKKTLEGEAGDILPDILRISASAGGRQAKALIDYNPSTQQIRSGFADVKKGFLPCLIKFDGAREGEEPNFYGRLEYTYAAMARLCGIDMPKTYLLEAETDDGPYAHFLIERFDRNEQKEKVGHYASLCGLILADFREKFSSTYEQYFSVTKALTRDASQVEEGFRRALFNILFRNQDDHSKNFGYLMDRRGQWKLSPAFDLNYVYGQGTSSTHQLKFANKEDGFIREDFIAVGKSIGIREKKVKELLDHMQSVGQNFLKLAKANGLDTKFAQGVAKRFRVI